MSFRDVYTQTEKLTVTYTKINSFILDLDPTNFNFL